MVSDHFPWLSLWKVTLNGKVAQQYLQVVVVELVPVMEYLEFYLHEEEDYSYEQYDEYYDDQYEEYYKQYEEENFQEVPSISISHEIIVERRDYAYSYSHMDGQFECSTIKDQPNYEEQH